MPDNPAPPPLPETEPLDARPLDEQALEVIRTVYDPEIPVNIYELGLIYNLEATAEGDVKVLMTLTSPSCPAAQSLPSEVEQKLNALPGVREAKVEITFEPTWTQDMMSESAKLELGMY